VVTKEEAKKVSAELGVELVETSALTGMNILLSTHMFNKVHSDNKVNVDEAFFSLAKKIMANTTNERGKKNIIHLSHSTTTPTAKESKKCC
jgi:Fe2+ transport system protein B